MKKFRIILPLVLFFLLSSAYCAEFHDDDRLIELHNLTNDTVWVQLSFAEEIIACPPQEQAVLLRSNGKKEYVALWENCSDWFNLVLDWMELEDVQISIGSHVIPRQKLEQRNVYTVHLENEEKLWPIFDFIVLIVTEDLIR